MMTSVRALVIIDLVVRRGGRLALDAISCEVQTGSVTGLLGPSGCGKSTLMRAIVGVQIIESGSVRVLGEPAGTPQLRRRVGYVTQAPSVYADLTVLENLRYFARVLGAGEGRVDQVIATVSLDDHADQVTGSLSGGQRARVSLATALIGEPELLVLDEPTLGLDILARRSFYDALVNDYMDETRTILITTHQVEEVENLLTDVIFIDKGRIVLDSSIEDIATRYAAVAVTDDNVAAARAEKPFYQRRTLGKTLLYFERPDFDRLSGLGEVLTPSVADLFVAKLSHGAA